MPSFDLSPEFLGTQLARAANETPASEPLAPNADPAFESVRRAAVAALVRSDGHVLLMQRAERVGDRWSGQIALPGGGVEPSDEDLVATAVRETREEVGRDLARSARLIGALPIRQAIARGHVQPLTVAPFVFFEEQPEPLALGPEASDAFWFPLADAANGAFDSTYRYQRNDGLVRKLPCWRAELASSESANGARERCVWGMTYFMLRELLEAARSA